MAVSWLVNWGDPNHLQVLGWSSKQDDMIPMFTRLGIPNNKTCTIALIERLDPGWLARSSITSGRLILQVVSDLFFVDYHCNHVSTIFLILLPPKLEENDPFLQTFFFCFIFWNKFYLHQRVSSRSIQFRGSLICWLKTLTVTVDFDTRYPIPCGGEISLEIVSLSFIGQDLGWCML